MDADEIVVQEMQCHRMSVVFDRRERSEWLVCRLDNYPADTAVHCPRLPSRI
jgi:hypothetical protein